MHRVVAIALAGNRIEITETVVNPLADDPDRHPPAARAISGKRPDQSCPFRVIRRIPVGSRRTINLIGAAAVGSPNRASAHSTAFGLTGNVRGCSWLKVP